MNCFIKVCDNKSISSTADLFFMFPQGVSKTIKRIETELDIELPIRTQNGVIMTEYGQLFYNLAKKIITEYNQTTKNESFYRTSKVVYSTHSKLRYAHVRKC